MHEHLGTSILLSLLLALVLCACSAFLSLLLRRLLVRRAKKEIDLSFRQSQMDKAVSTLQSEVLASVRTFEHIPASERKKLADVYSDRYNNLVMIADDVYRTIVAGSKPRWESSDGFLTVFQRSFRERLADVTVLIYLFRFFSTTGAEKDQATFLVKSLDERRLRSVFEAYSLRLFNGMAADLRRARSA